MSADPRPARELHVDDSPQDVVRLRSQRPRAPPGAARSAWWRAEVL